MRKVKFVSVFMLLALFSGGAGTTVMARSLSGFDSPGWNLHVGTTQPVIEWRAYHDPDYGFTLKHPTRWTAEITMDVNDFCSNLRSPKREWILRRHSIAGPGGAFDLDVWTAHGLDLSAWLEWMGEITAPFPVTEPNARVAGYPAVAFVQNEMLTVFFSDGEHVYRLWYTGINTDTGLEVYQHLLSTVRLPESTTTGTRIPESVMQDAQQAVEAGAGANCMADSSCYSVWNGCCGLSSSYCSTYFPCSRENGQDKGNCTWYVCYRYGSVPFRGDAGTWWDQVPNYAAWDRGYSPYPYHQNVAWWGGSPGHVAYSESGGSSTIYEMAWCSACERERPSWLSSPTGYIWSLYY